MNPECGAVVNSIFQILYSTFGGDLFYDVITTGGKAEALIVRSCRRGYRCPITAGCRSLRRTKKLEADVGGLQPAAVVGGHKRFDRRNFDQAPLADLRRLDLSTVEKAIGCRFAEAIRGADIGDGGVLGARLGRRGGAGRALDMRNPSWN